MRFGAYAIGHYVITYKLFTYSGLTSFLTLLLALLLPTSVLSQSASAGKFVPFKGNIGGLIQLEWTPLGEPILTSDIEVTGTHVGKGNQFVTAIDLSQFPFVTEGAATIVAASGDTVDLTFVLYAVDFAPPALTYQGTYTITGGTGRLDPVGTSTFEPGIAGEGSIVGTALLNIDDLTGALTLDFDHTFSGTICKPKQ